MSPQITVFTIGFTKKNAEQFFTSLKSAGVKRLIDTRLNNVSQLAGFAKRDDLRFFLKALYGIEYTHLLHLAPTQELLGGYKKNGESWDWYEREFNALISNRKIELSTPLELLDNACLLCSEHLPKNCHRRLVVEYLQRHFAAITVRHL